MSFKDLPKSREDTGVVGLFGVGLVSPPLVLLLRSFVSVSEHLVAGEFPMGEFPADLLQIDRFLFSLEVTVSEFLSFLTLFTVSVCGCEGMIDRCVV